MIEVYIDGASAGHPGVSGAGVYLKGGGINEQYSIPLGVMSNHEAEFHALLHAMKKCKEKNIPAISLRTDSKLVEESLEKRYVKREVYANILAEVLPIIDTFDLFFVKWIASKENHVADKLARQAIWDQLTGM